MWSCFQTHDISISASTLVTGTCHQHQQHNRGYFLASARLLSTIQLLTSSAMKQTPINLQCAHMIFRAYAHRVNQASNMSNKSVGVEFQHQRSLNTRCIPCNCKQPQYLILVCSRPRTSGQAELLRRSLISVMMFFCRRLGVHSQLCPERDSCCNFMNTEPRHCAVSLLAGPIMPVTEGCTFITGQGSLFLGCKGISSLDASYKQTNLMPRA